MKKKLDKFNYYVKNTLLLISKEIIMKGDRFVLKEKKEKIDMEYLEN